MRRTILAVALLLVAGTCSAQRREGVYKPVGGTPVAWSINDHQTLIWDSKPYLPVGIRIDGTVQAVDAAKAAGITDVIVDLPSDGIGWDDVVAALNKAGMRYLVRIDSLAPMAKGFAVEPQGYRVTGITKSREITLDIPAATSAYVILATKGDGTIVASGRVPITDGKLTYFAKIGPEIEHVLLVYPEMTSIDQQDYWEDLDNERDKLLSTIKKHPLGAGMRGFVNPMGRGLATTLREPRFVPTSRYFRMELRKYLEDKYKNVETLLKNWAMTSSSLTQLDEKKRLLATFDALSVLVPLWSSTRGIGAMLNPDTNVTYACDNRHSKAWEDISQVVNTAGEHRFGRFVPAIRSVADVPVIQDWLGWAAPYETKSPTIDGVGVRAAGTTQSALSESGSRAVSSVLRWGTYGWIVATDLDLGGGHEAETQLSGALDDLGSMGAKGIFVRTDSTTLMKGVAAESKRRAEDSSQMSRSPVPVFFPENAYNPAVPQRLPGDHFWLPTPSDGNRIDLGAQFFAYRAGIGDGSLALWTRTPGRYLLRMMNPKAIRFTTLDGSNPSPKLGKGGVEVSLTEFPLLISGTFEVPVPQVAFLESVDRFRTMLSIAQQAHMDTGEEELYYRQAVEGFDRNPGGSFDQLRIQYWKLAQKVSSYCWIEAEHFSDSNFSEVVRNPGCSGGAALSLRTLVPPGRSGYFAEYAIPVKSQQDQELWIAAKIPAERRGDVTVTIGGQQLRLSGEPLSLYGGGFGWYHLGTTRVAGHNSRLRIQVDTASNTEIAIDAILMTPNSFTPNGVTPPDPIAFRQLLMKPQKGSKKRGSGGS